MLYCSLYRFSSSLTHRWQYALIFDAFHISMQHFVMLSKISTLYTCILLFAIAYLYLSMSYSTIITYWMFYKHVMYFCKYILLCKTVLKFRFTSVKWIKCNFLIANIDIISRYYLESRFQSFLIWWKQMIKFLL